MSKQEYEKFYAEDVGGDVVFTGGEPTGDGNLIGEVSASVMLAMVSGKPQELLSEIIDGLPERVFEDFQSQLGTLSDLLNLGLPDDWRPNGWGCQDDSYKSPPPDFVMTAAELFIKNVMDFDRIAAWMLDGEFEDNPADPDYGDSCEYAFLKAITTPEGRKEYRGYLVGKLHEWGPRFVGVDDKDLEYVSPRAARWYRQNIIEETKEDWAKAC